MKKTKEKIDESIELLTLYKKMTDDNKKLFKGILIGMSYRFDLKGDIGNGK